MFPRVPYGKKQPLQFGREVMCHALGQADRIVWKRCVLPAKAESQQTKAFQKKFNEFDPSKGDSDSDSSDSDSD